MQSTLVGQAAELMLEIHIATSRQSKLGIGKRPADDE